MEVLFLLVGKCVFVWGRWGFRGIFCCSWSVGWLLFERGGIGEVCSRVKVFVGFWDCVGCIKFEELLLLDCGVGFVCVVIGSRGRLVVLKDYRVWLKWVN